MSYAAWRISFQSSEQAARAAWEESQRLQVIEQAARNLCTVKGRHHSEIAMRKLMDACGIKTPNAEVTRPGGFSPGPVSEANEG